MVQNLYLTYISVFTLFSLYTYTEPFDIDVQGLAQGLII